MNSRLTLLLILVVLGCPQVLGQQGDPLPGAVQEFEKLRMQWLARQQERVGNPTSRFQSDGCSGGLSETWRGLAETLPGFGNYLGDKPPWEYCCVEHDRAYWAGETDGGFERRLVADEALRQCVADNGRLEGDVIARKLGVTKSDVVEAVDLIADTMFDAVRIGGGPCTGLPWRWGHGWPACLDSQPEAASSI